MASLAMLAGGHSANMLATFGDYSKPATTIIYQKTEKKTVAKELEQGEVRSISCESGKITLLSKSKQSVIVHEVEVDDDEKLDRQSPVLAFFARTFKMTSRG